MLVFDPTLGAELVFMHAARVCVEDVQESLLGSNFALMDVGMPWTSSQHRAPFPDVQVLLCRGWPPQSQDVMIV